MATVYSHTNWQPWLRVQRELFRDRELGEWSDLVGLGLGDFFQVKCQFYNTGFENQRSVIL